MLMDVGLGRFRMNLRPTLKLWKRKQTLSNVLRMKISASLYVCSHCFSDGENDALAKHDHI